MSFTVIGDTVNTTSRIQELCRSLQLELLVTQELIDEAKLESNGKNPDLARFINAGAHSLRGRSQPIKVLTPKLDHTYNH